MKTLRSILFALVCACSLLPAQTHTCNINAGNAPVTSPFRFVFDNRSLQCAAFRVSYESSGFTVVSIHVQSATATAPTVWTDITGSALISGSNPMSDTASGTLVFRAVYAWISINVATTTGTGSIIVKGYGDTGTSALIDVDPSQLSNQAGLQAVFTNACPMGCPPSGTNFTLSGLGGLTSIPINLLGGLGALTTLDLHNNALTSLPAGIFDHNTALIYLLLGTNALTSLPAGIFDHNTALIYLNLDHNALTSLPAGVFDHNTALIYLYLDHNALTSLPAGIFDHNTALTYLDISTNALDVSSVNTVLFELASTVGSRAVCTLDLSGGTNAVPTTGPPDGITAVQTLVTAGWTVTTSTVTLPITGVDQGLKTFTVVGDQTAYFEATEQFTVSGSTGNDGTYTVVSASFGAGSTSIVVVEAIPDATADGSIVVI